MYNLYNLYNYFKDKYGMSVDIHLFNSMLYDNILDYTIVYNPRILIELIYIILYRLDLYIKANRIR